MATLASLIVELAANTAKFQQGMQQAVGTAQKSASQIQSSLSSIQASFGGAIAMVQRFAGALGLVVGVGGLVAAGRAAMNFADEIDEMSERLGIGAERLQELRFAAGQSGVSAEKLELGIRNLGTAISEAAGDPAGASAKKFREMGISIEGVAGMTAPLEVVMGRVADRINSAVSPTEKLGIASNTLGERVGSFLIPILGRGQKGIEDWGKAARDAGVVMSTEMIQQAAKAKDMLDAMATAIMANLVPAIVAISPLLIKMAQGLSDIAAAAGRAMGSFAPFAAMTTEDLRSQLAKVDADLAKRREFLQKLREENEERSKGVITQFLPKSPGAIPHEIQRLQLEKEAIEKILAERGAKTAPDVRGMVIGAGIKDDKVLEGLRKKLQDLGTEDDFAKQIVALQRDLAAAKKEAPGLTAEIDRLGAAMFEAATNQKVFADALKHRAAAAEAEAKTEQESADVTAEAWRFYYEYVKAQEAQRVADAAAAAASQVESAQLVQDALDEAQATTANLPKSLTAVFAEDMRRIAAMAALLGDAADATSATIARLQQEMRLAVDNGAEPFHEAMLKLRDEIDSLRVVGVFDDLDKGMRNIAAQAQVLGNSFDTVAAEISKVRQALVELMGMRQTSETEQAIAHLTQRLNELNTVALAQEGVRDIFGALNQAVNQSVAGIIQGTITLKQAFENMGQSIAISLVQNIINRAIKQIEEALITLLAKLAGAGVSGLGYGAGIEAAGAPVMVGAGSGIPGAAEGAYVKARPGGVAMLVGEGGKDEAIFPLDRIPVNPGSGGGKTKIIINNNAGAEVGASEKQTPDGRQIEVMIDRVVQDGFSSGRYGGVLTSTYGLNRKGRVS